jgi:hypothetical protein
VQKIEEMRITIEDLEALKELNDELEENHMETEKQLHEDLGKTSIPYFGFSDPFHLHQSRKTPRFVNTLRRSRH